MTGPQHGKPPWATSWGNEPAEDLLAQGRDRPEGPEPEPEPVHRAPRWSPRLGRTGKLTAKLVVAALAVGLLGGYLGGYQIGDAHARGLIPKPKPTSALALSSFGLAETGAQCSTTLGRQLQIGVEVVNGSPAAIRLGALTARFPRGGMTATGATAWEPCGTLPNANAANGPVLPVGASTWLSVTVTTSGECPDGLPVEYVASFDQDGQTYTVALPGFVEMGTALLKGCPAASGLS
jgi:hypothetical protein